MKTTGWSTGASSFGSRGRVASVSLVLILLIAGCTGSDDTASTADSVGRSSQGEDRALEMPSGNDEAEQAGGAGAGGAVSGETAMADAAGGTSGGALQGAATKLPDLGPSVIKTATVNIGVPDDELDQSLNDAIGIAGRYGGFVLSSQLGRKGAGGTLTMRIPAERFEAALADLEGLGKLRGESISGEDVGQEFVDLEARLRNWKSQEAVLLKLMGRAESVVDTIRVQGELSRVQLEIEQLEGRLRFLRDQTSLGTITASFGPLSAPAPSTPSRFAQAWSRAVELMQSFVAGIIVTSGVVIPLALIALLLLVVYRAFKPRLTQ